MSCCPPECCNGTNKFFSRRSKSYIKRFKRKGLEKVQRYLLETVKKESLSTKEILDIGCGVGSLHLTLLGEGAAKATGVDISEGMLDHARKLSAEMGFQDRTRYVLGDFVEKAPEIPEVDITLLDKVVCCYENLDALIEASTARTRSFYGLTHPRNSFLMKGVFKTQIFFSRLFRTKFRPFWHDWARMREMIIARGFRPVFEKPTIAWQTMVFQRI